MFNGRKNVIVIFAFLIVNMFVFFAGCSEESSKENATNFIEEYNDYNINDTGLEQSVEKSKHELSAWRAVGKEVKKLSEEDWGEETLIIVGEYKITKKEIEMQRLLNKLRTNDSLKETINSIIQSRVIKSEAERLKIFPSQKKIDDYIEQINESLKNEYEGAEHMLAFIEGAEITIEEYLISFESTAYDLFQREKLWEYVNSTKKYKDFDEYITELVDNYNVEILDYNVREILK